MEKNLNEEKEIHKSITSKYLGDIRKKAKETEAAKSNI